MSDVTQPPSALTVFLDLSPEETDPRVLLGLPEGVVERPAVLNALRSRLAQVAAHRLGGTPEASEVRILLHAAAARLLMPLSAVPQPRLPVSLAPAEVVASDLDVASRVEFERGAMLILGQHGGLSEPALHALRMLALTHGVPVDQVVPEVMAMLTGTGVSQPVVPRTPPAPRVRRVHRHPASNQGGALRPASIAQADAPATAEEFVEPQVLKEQADPGLIFIKRMVIAAAVVVVLLVVGAVGLYFMTAGPKRLTGGGSVPAEGASDATQTAATVTPGESPGPSTQATADEPPPVVEVSLDEVIRGVRDAAVELDAAPESAMKKFEASVGALTERWPNASPAQSAAMVDAAMEFVYRSSSGADRAQRAIGTLVSGVDLLTPRPEWTARDVTHACFSAGMLARLLRERDLPSSILGDLHRRGRPTFGDATSLDGSFGSGVTATVGRLPGLLMGEGAQGRVKVEPRAWEAYAECVAAGIQRDAALRQQVLLGALERVVLTDRDPHQDASIMAAEAALTKAVGFGTGSPARERLVQWLSRSDVTTSDLHTITAAILDAGQNRELDITMVVSLNATDLDRAELKSRYESAWGVVGAAAPREYAGKWVDRAKGELAAESPGAAPMDQLVQATRYAALNAAAMRMQDGDASTVDALLGNSEIGVRFLQQPNNTWYTLTATSEGTWAARYLAAGQDIPKRREILSQVNSEPTPVDAAVLVMEATRGAPAQVRADARRVLARYTSSPTIVAALLDFASFIPPTRENAAVIESVLGDRLPTARSPAWRVSVRRALVRRMLELASSDEGSFVDLSADHIRRQYDDALSSWSGAGGAKTAKAAVAGSTISESVSAVRERLVADGKKIVIAPSGVPTAVDVLARLQERRSRADGDIHVFVAEQAACTELLALLTASERPGVAGAVTGILDEWDQARRGAGHVFEQVNAGERAMCRLWGLRLGGEP